MKKLILTGILLFSFISHAEDAAESDLDDKALTQATETMMQSTPESKTKDSVREPASTLDEDNKELSTKEESDPSSKKEEQIPAFHEAKVKADKPQSLWGRLVLSFLVVAAVAVGLILATRRWSKTKNVVGSKAKVKINHQLHLGPKKSIALIEVAGEHLLIGVTDQNINLLKTISIITDEIPDQVPDNFQDVLNEDFQFGKNYDARMN